MSLVLPSASSTVAAKSMRNIDRLSRVVLVCSCRRVSTFSTFFLSNAESTVLAMRLSSIRYLKTESYIGLATLIVIICLLSCSLLSYYVPKLYISFLVCKKFFFLLCVAVDLQQKFAFSRVDCCRLIIIMRNLGYELYRIKSNCPNFSSNLSRKSLADIK